MGNDDGENGEEIHHEFDLSSSLSDVGLVLLPFCVCSPWAFVSYEGRFLCVCVCRQNIVSIFVAYLASPSTKCKIKSTIGYLQILNKVLTN